MRVVPSFLRGALVAALAVPALPVLVLAAAVPAVALDDPPPPPGDVAVDCPDAIQSTPRFLRSPTSPTPTRFIAVLERSALSTPQRPRREEVAAHAQDLADRYGIKVGAVFTIIPGFAFEATEEAAARLSDDALIGWIEQGSELETLDRGPRPRIRRLAGAQPERYMVVLAKDVGLGQVAFLTQLGATEVGHCAGDPPRVLVQAAAKAAAAIGVDARVAYVEELP